ncbi:MAG: cadmium-translocating P-type ATPase [Gemmatimonadota bacterium]|nr:MAG: cadmium-translocating P-type ATPase [Gemmatimonadota bacterium]
MDCASCAQRISDRLARLDGVEAVEPRVILKDVRVRYDPSLTAEDAIADAVRSLGYTVKRDGRERETGLEPRRGVWAGRDAWRTYVAGLGIAVGLLLRLFGPNPTLFVGIAAPLDAAALLFVAAALTGGLNFFPKGLRAARIVRLDMNFLMTVAIFGALFIGEYVEAASIAFLFGIAELLERYSVERARRSIESLLDLAPASARVRRDGAVVTVAVEELVPGDVVQVAPGEKVPIDGWVEEGASAVDQSPITGESLPVSKEIGDYVYAGSMNRQGYLEIRASKSAADTTLAHIIHLVEEAEAARSPSERFVEKFARFYTPAVTILAVAVMVVPPLLLGAAFSTWFVRGLTLLVVSCPCALVISTPVAVVSGITSAARNGVLIKGGVHLEALAGVRAVAIDKTGTLTTGEVTFVEILTADGDAGARSALAIAGTLAARSEHPVSQAIARAAAESGLGLDTEILDFAETPGAGLEGRLDGVTYRLGRPELFARELPRWNAELERIARAGWTPVCLGHDDGLLGLIAVADREREEGRATIQELRRQGLGPIVMLTGDHEQTARAIAERLGVDEWYAGLLPRDKVAKVRELAARYGKVAMIGDGVNDAPALAAATVGIAMGAAASDIALETADVAVMADDLTCLPYLFRLSRRSGHVIRQNVAASIAIKFSLAAGALPGWVTLITAVLVGDMGASLAVTGNALRLARLRR